MTIIKAGSIVEVKTTNGGAGLYVLVEDHTPTYSITVARRVGGPSFSIPGWRLSSVELIEGASPRSLGMVQADRHEADWRKHTRPAQPGNNRATVRETLRMLDRGTLVLNSDLVV